MSERSLHCQECKFGKPAVSIISRPLETNSIKPTFYWLVYNVKLASMVVHTVFVLIGGVRGGVTQAPAGGCRANNVP